MSDYDIVEIKRRENKYNDNVHRPSHYSKHGFTPLDAFRKGLLSKEETEGFMVGSAIKYLCRHKYKNGVEDLDKAIEYIELLKKFMYD